MSIWIAWLEGRDDDARTLARQTMATVERVRQPGSRGFADLMILRGNETLPYEIVEFDPPRLVAFRGETKTTRYHDRIQISDERGGTRLIYDAELTLKGLLEIGAPAFQLLFERIGRDATEPIPAAVIQAVPSRPNLE